ncbi:MAG: hypothetical protein ACLFVL_03745 [Candidatus Aenigmatarchaeota archaeon]
MDGIEKKRCDPRNLKRSEEGVMDYPFRLLIIAIVLAIAIPSMLSALSHYRTNSAEEQLSQEVNQIASAVESVYIQGVNASTVLEIEFPPETEEVKVGAPLSGSVHTRAIYYQLREEPEKSILVTHGRKGIPMCSPDNDTLIIPGGNQRISIVKKPADFDMNEDGVENDYYVELDVLEW